MSLKYVLVLIDTLLFGVSAYVGLKLLLASLGAVYVGLAAGAVGAVVAGCLGLTLCYLISRFTLRMIDNLFESWQEARA